MSERVVAIGEPVRALAARLGLPWQAEGEADATLCLSMCDEGLALSGDTRRYGAPIRIDFMAGKVAHRRRFGGGRGQLIAKACGLAHGVTPSIVDATAGLGRDAFVLATLGAEVLLIERVAAIYALLEDGLDRASANAGTAEIVARMRVAHGDATRELATLVARHGVAPQVVHLDPMFPHRDKSALVKKEMRVFRELAGHDDDASCLLEAALEVATHRVVVKRPRRAPPLDGRVPDHTLEGKTSRYDLYVHRSLKPA
ncbi:16S rRNA (guanine1516-N2)-methyltransferase [Chromohalobacter marismortui]|uniref:Ribosomal RNA small subunit methyltransferase J n=1 Tax=Chromohalobacter marismortui TaxID=42055 RepID=A0A4R7NSU0_9GAMM|nr:MULTISPECIES: class I SAM-dependent methyltransferase [Chromohalobacter]MCI0509345.1 class I SAM-dependent methyltransferase [Chromohalobacter sp.]MCI0592350.1 class I SAM-dependent methyltransferase [Chromohalobacter sp.]TDU23762.1 16S rRNA (guanine1516-N2)-methyltransferase [Chromohalobacter marismortui]